MSTLGIGTRVFVGWTNDCPHDITHCRLKTATITDGPYYWEERWMWEILMDFGDFCYAAERILFPFNDGDQFDDSVLQGQPEELACN